MTHQPEGSSRVRQLRVIVEAHDYEAAVTFYRDVLGMDELGRVSLVQARWADLVEACHVNAS